MILFLLCSSTVEIMLYLCFVIVMRCLYNVVIFFIDINVDSPKESSLMSLSFL